MPQHSPMAFIKTIPPEEAEADLRDLYRRVGNPDGTVDRVMQIHSLSPASLRAHFELYVTAMHRKSPLSRAEREIVGVVVSRLNGCRYCTVHHAAGLRGLLPEERADVADALEAGRPAELTARERAMVAYAEKLTRRPDEMDEADAQRLRDAGLDDREILDLAQIIGYFCYVNRLVTGLGVTLEPSGVGQHPASPGD